MMLGRVLGWALGFILMVTGFSVAIGGVYSFTRALIGAMLFLIGGLLVSRIVYVAQKEDGNGKG